MLCLWATPSWAVFTAAEITSIQGIHTCLSNIDDAQNQFAGIIENSNANNRAQQSTAWVALMTAQNQLAKAIAYLFDVDPVTDGGTFANRAAAVALANTAVSSAQTDFTTARTAFQAFAIEPLVSSETTKS